MIKFSKIFFYLTIALIAIWQLPWLGKFFTGNAHSSTFTIYSSVIGEFAMSGNDASGRMSRWDLQGRQYTVSEFDSILPCFYSRQLFTDGRFPETINGEAVNFRDVQNNSFIFRNLPNTINLPKLQLYSLLESMSGRVDLKMPEDVFRITDKRIEFVDAASNSINEQKSQLFTDMMLSKGFIFPAKSLSGNPTTKKEYDEGYLVIDNTQQLFHLKMTKGRPYVRKIDLPEGMKLKNVFITEFKSRRYLGFLVDENNSFHVLHAKSYEIIKSELPEFDPSRMAISIIGNQFDWTVRLTSVSSDAYYAIDGSDFTLIKSFVSPEQLPTFGQKVVRYLPPVSLQFTAQEDKFIFPRFSWL